MPRVEINRSKSGLPSQTGVGNVPGVSADPNAGVLARTVGGAISAFAGEKVEEANLARDSSFVASSTVQANKMSFDMAQKMKEDYAGDPTGYSDAVFNTFQQSHQKLLDQAPSKRARAALQEKLNALTLQRTTDAQAYERETFVVHQETQLLEGRNTLTAQISAGEIGLDEAFAQFREFEDGMDIYMSPTDKANKTIAARKDFIEAQTMALAKSGDFEGARGLVQSDMFDKELSMEDKVRLEASVGILESKAEENGNKLLQEAKQDTSNMVWGLANANDIPGAMKVLHEATQGDDPLIPYGSPTYRTLSEFIKKTMEEEGITQTSIARVDRVVSGEGSLDLDNKDDVKNHQRWWDSRHQGVSIFEADEQQLQAMMNDVYSAKAMPKSLRDGLDQAMLNGSPKSKEIAAGFLIEIGDASDDLLLRGLKDETLGNARRIQNLAMVNGGSFEEAARIIESNDSKGIGEDQKSEVRSRALEYVRGKEAQKYIADTMDWENFMGANKELPAALVTQIESAVADNSVAHMNQNSSPQLELEIAVEKIQKHWKPTKVFGRESLVFGGFGSVPKEMAQGGERSNFATKQAEEQISRFIDYKTGGMMPEAGKSLAKRIEDTAVLVPAEENGEKVYKVWYRNGNDALVLAEDAEGNPATVSIDRRKEPGVAVLERKARFEEAKISSVKQIRQVREALLESGMEQPEHYVDDLIGGGGTSLNVLNLSNPKSELGKKVKEAEAILRDASERNSRIEKGTFEGYIPNQQKKYGAFITASEQRAIRAEGKKYVAERMAEAEQMLGDAMEELGLSEKERDMSTIINELLSPKGQENKGGISPQEMQEVSSLARQAEIGGNEHLQYKVHIPKIGGQVVGKSGVTVGVGFDLGQHSETEIQEILTEAGVPQDKIDDLKTFSGLKGDAALTAMSSSPVNGITVLTPEQSNKIFEIKFREPLKKTDEVIGSIKGLDKQSPGAIMLREALSSAMYQMDLTKTFPNAMKQLKMGNYRAAAEAFTYVNRSDKTKGASKWAQQTPERILPILEALEEISGKELKSILMSANGVDTSRLA